MDDVDCLLGRTPDVLVPSDRAIPRAHHQWARRSSSRRRSRAPRRRARLAVTALMAARAGEAQRPRRRSGQAGAPQASCALRRGNNRWNSTSGSPTANRPRLARGRPRSVRGDQEPRSTSQLVSELGPQLFDVADSTRGARSRVSARDPRAAAAGAAALARATASGSPARSATTSSATGRSSS